MSILSDQEITALCVLPSQILDEKKYWLEKGKPYFSPDIFFPDPRDRIAQEARRDEAIREKCMRALTDEERTAFKPMIEPFISHQVKQDENGKKLISYGLSSFGYDARIAREFKIFTNINSTIVDPKQFDKGSFVDFEGDVCIIPPNSFVLARTVEKFCIPSDVVGICVGKSTMARVGINCLVTPLEPGWSGYLTLEFANTSPLPAKIYANEGGLQIQFHRGKEPKITYATRGGKYQNQGAEITLPKV